MSFMSKQHRTPAYERAVEVLRALLQQQSLDDVERAFAEVASPVIAAKVAKGYTPSNPNRHVCVHRLVGERCPEDRGLHGRRCETQYLPAVDHLSGWKQDGKLTRIISQPYGMSYENVKKTVEFCERWGLEADISAWHSWHFPGHTLAVTYERKAAPKPQAEPAAFTIDGVTIH
jgi:hypothetical protein